MRKFEVSISNTFINFIYGSILFWVYLLLLKDLSKLRQLGSIPLPSYFILFFIYFIVSSQTETAVTAYITILLLTGILQCFVAYEFRKEYLQLVKLEEKEEWARIMRGEADSHNVPLLQVVGHSVDSLFLGLLFTLLTVIFTFLGVGSIYTGSVSTGFLFLVLSGVCLLILQSFENKAELTGSAYEEAVRKHYENASFIKKLLKPIKIIDKL